MLTAENMHVRDILELFKREDAGNEESRIKEHIKNANRMRKGRDASDIIELELLLDFVRSYNQSIAELERQSQHRQWK
jgi:hypothetical protein